MEKMEMLVQKIQAAELVLVGLGEKFIPKENEEIIKKAYGKLSALLTGKNYFIISLCEDKMIYEAGLKADRIVQPIVDDEGWETYMKWLQGTLNRKLLVLELGVGLKHPNVIRFPFEKIVYFNQKADFLRVHAKLFQLPAELGGRGNSVEEDPLALLAETKNEKYV